MPIYHFNLHNSLGFAEDEDGRELADLTEARGEALKGIRSIMAEEVMRGHVDLDGRLEVLDDDGCLLLTIAFAEAVDGIADISARPLVDRVDPD